VTSLWGCQCDLDQCIFWCAQLLVVHSAVALTPAQLNHGFPSLPHLPVSKGRICSPASEALSSGGPCCGLICRDAAQAMLADSPSPEDALARALAKITGFKQLKVCGGASRWWWYTQEAAACAEISACTQWSPLCSCERQRVAQDEI
jgi:hypothetical protein